MESSSNKSSGIDSMMKTWTESMQSMLETMPEWWTSFGKIASQNQTAGQNGMPDMDATLKYWQSLASAMTTPESMSAFLKGAETIPDMTLQFSQSVIDSFAELQKRMAKGVSSFNESVEAYKFDQMDESMLHVWTDIYEKEFQKFFHIPQLGLTREYQERFNDMMDKFHQFQANHSEFMRLMGLPFQRAVPVMQEKIASMAEEGELPDDAHHYYQMWIKVLEGHFMTLFQTPEYVEALSNTVSALSRFSKSRDSVIEDMMQGLPIAQRSEIDELAKEVYLLKKKIKALEKKI